MLAGAGDPLPEGSAYREAAGKGSVLAGVDGSPLEGPVGQEAAGKGTVLAGTEGSFYREAVGGSPVPGEEPHQGNMPSAPGMGGSLAAEDTVPAGMLPAEFTAQRQLEEIRLKMTVSSAVRMMQKGIAIEVVPLQELIEELRQQEREYYQQIAPEGKLDGKQMDLAQEALTRAEDIRRAPAYILGGIRQYNLLTMNVLHRAAVSATVQMRQYQVDYEAVGTQVREDLGDSIKKAFAGIPDLLGELGLEDTEANERAVRILGYNRMAVTEENISRVKEADAVVNSVIDHMKPSVVMELIRRGDDPLTLPLDELDAKLRTIADGQDIAPEERYSRYLWRLERENGITEQEREGYIGIYRLLHQISRSDGAVVGAVMEAGWDMTMGNLRTAARSIRQRGIDVRVNDSFGEPVSLRNEGNSVTRQTGDRSGGMDQDGQSPREQDAAEMASSHAEREDPPVQQEHMSASGQDVGSGQGQTAAGQDADPGQRRFTAGQDQASGERQPASGQEPDPRQSQAVPGQDQASGERQPASGQESDPGQSQAVPGQDQGSGHEQTAAGQDVVTGYYSRLAHQAWQEITPAALRQISDGDLGNVSGMSLEMFQQKLGQASGDAQVEQRLYEQLASQLRQAAEQSQEGARYLEQNGIPDTIANLQAAQRLVHGYDVFREISGMRKRLSRERPEDAGTVRKDDVEGGLLEDIFSDRLSDSLESAGSMEAEYARMEHMMEQILDRSYARSGITGEEITRLRQLGQNMALQRQMVRRYSYDIPIETEDTVTTLNVTLIQGGEDTGKVQICMEGTGTAEEGQDVPPGEEGSGRISAELRLSRGRVKGLVLCEKRACYEQLSGQRGLLEEQIEEKGFTVGNISYSLDPRSRAGAVSGARGDRVPSAQLFQLAKLAVQHVAHVLRSAA